MNDTEKREYYRKLRESVSIIDYARELGFTVKRQGRRHFTLKEHDSVIIDPQSNLFWRNSTGENGSVIDFALCFTDMTIQEVLKDLDKRAGNSKLVTAYPSDRQLTNNNKVVFTLPEADKNAKNVFAYINKTRGIDARIISELMHRKMIYQDTKKNCVFVSYKDGEPVFACKRGTNTHKPFYGDVAGCDYSFLFFIDNDSNHLFVTESIIDTLSVMTMLSMNDTDYSEYNYLALAGARKFESAIDYHIKRKSYKSVVLALDNDMAGLKAAHDITQQLVRLDYTGRVKMDSPMYGKDKNDELIYRKEHDLWDR